jgi:hypothetical protein
MVRNLALQQAIRESARLIVRQSKDHCAELDFLFVFPSLFPKDRRIRIDASGQGATGGITNQAPVSIYPPS